MSWDSGTETGFTVVAGGDFNGDGDDELVAARGSIVKVFDPVVKSGKAAVWFAWIRQQQKRPLAQHRRFRC